MEIIEIWKLQNSEDFWDVFTLPENLVKEDLINYLLYEYGTLEPVDSNSKFFRERIRNFFKIHDWNIKELAETLDYEYDPLADSKWHRHYDRTIDDTTDLTSERDISEVDKTVEDDDWTEHDVRDETDINYVSAYNMALSTQNNISDSEHHRDTINEVIDKKGTDDKTTDFTGKTDDDVKSKEVYDDEMHSDTYHDGNNNHTFQSLIEEERKQAQFNIYKWIAKHFSTECLICVW